MNCNTFEPQSASTPKKFIRTLVPNLCSTPRPGHARLSLSKGTPLPIHSSTPNGKKVKKTFAPDINRLIYPATVSTTNPMKIWVI